MKRSILALFAALAIVLTGCGGPSYSTSSYYGVCVDPVTQIRLPDYRCSATGGYSTGIPFWAYMPYGAVYPAYGVAMPVSRYHYVTTPPRGVTAYRGGVSTTGGKVNLKKYKPAATVGSNGKVSTQKQNSTTSKPKSSSKPNSGFGSGSKKSSGFGGSSKPGGFSGGGSRSGGSRR